MPLEPVAPLPLSAPAPTRSPEESSPWPSLILVAVAGLSLALNGFLGWHVLRTERRQERRLARLEAAGAAGVAEDKNDGGAGAAELRLPRQATAEQRVAALLAVAGDANRCRRLLDNLSTKECVQVGQALIARPAAGDRNGALAAVITFLAGSEPLRAAGLLADVQEPVLRTTLALGLVETWTGSHPDDAARWLATDGMRFLTTPAASGPMVRAVTQWASFDPAAAARFVVAQPPDRGPIARALFLASRAWGLLDPAAALAWVDSLPPSDQRHGQALQGAWEGWTERDPAQAGAALRQQLYTAANRPPVELAGTVGKQWAQADPAAAAQWAQGLTVGSARRVALYQVALAWTQTDTAGAARWATTLPAGDTRAAIWSEIAADWADNDVDAAGVWLGGLPLGRDHDEAVAAYLPKVEPTEPEKALAWVATVSDPGIRADQVQRVLNDWQRRDGPAARNWAAANAVNILPLRSGGAGQ